MLDAKTKSIYLLIMLLGVVSMMGDIVYEGGRGVVPDYLQFLGASAFVVGLVYGLGDFIGYGVRLLSGYLVDEKRAYWGFMFIGYGLIVAIPLLSIANVWSVAVLLIILERLGKAIRAPARDTIVSVVSKGVGVGKAFGLHELFDQIGAVIGPLLVSTIMFMTANNYSLSFGLLFIPYFILIALLFYMFTRLRGKVGEAVANRSKRAEVIPKGFYFYIFAVAANVLGLVHVSLILYKASLILNPSGLQWIVPLLFTLVQLVDAPSALLSGLLFDRLGLKVLLLPFTVSVIPSIFVYYDSNLISLVVASAVYGVVLGMQESIYRAAVVHFAPPSVRGTAYGIFNTIYGVGILVSGVVFGFFIDAQIILPLVLAYVVAMQIIAIILLLRSAKLIDVNQKTFPIVHSPP